MATGEGVAGNDDGDQITGAIDAIKSMPGDISKGIAGGPIGLAITGMMKIGETIVEVLSKVMKAIIDASPMLQGVLKIIDKMFKLILMPIGNMIAKMLLPLAIKMANKSIALMNKYANSSPEKLGDAAADSFSVITESMVEMAAVVLVKALAPLFVGMVTGVVQGIGAFLGGSSGGTVDYTSGLKEASSDLKSIMGKSATGVTSVIDQFGLTVSTGNKAVGTSTSELATVIWNGSDSIEDGFQSSSNVIAIGSTKALTFLDEYNIANAGLVTIVDTTTSAFTKLSDALDVYRTKTNEPENNKKTEGSINKGSGWEWWQWGLAVAAPVAALTYMSATGDDTQGTGTFNRNKANNSNISNNGGNINITITGDVYGDSDFEGKITKIVDKAYSAKMRGSY